MGRVGRLFSRRAGHLSVTVDGKLTDPKTQLVVSQALPQAYHESACMVLFITSAVTSNGSLSGGYRLQSFHYEKYKIGGDNQ